MSRYCSRDLLPAKTISARLFRFVSRPLSKLLLSTIAALLVVSTAHSAGPLQVNPANPRYFVDAQGVPVYLAGTYLPHEQIEIGTIDFIEYLDFLQQQRHNFTRLWAWEQSPLTAKNPLAILPYQRTGPGIALDGGPKFDLRRFNQDYFDQLRDRVQQAAQRGVYVSVVLFQGSNGQVKKQTNNFWNANPFHRDNNINRIDGDTNGDGIGDEAFTLAIPAITSLQQAYIRKVVDTLNDLDNVLYEISGDAPLGNSAWQYHMINYLKSYQAAKLYQHPVGMNYIVGTNSDDAFKSPADWIAVFESDLNPSLATGGKVLFLETNPSLLGNGSSQESVWKSFTRGFNVIDKEPDSLTPGVSDSLHAALAQSLAYSQIIDLSAMAPSDAVCTSSYCLAKPGAEYLVYLPSGGRVVVDLSTAQKNFLVNWFNPSSGQSLAGNAVSGGGRVTFNSPFNGATVLHLSAQPQAPTQVSSNFSGGPGGSIASTDGFASPAGASQKTVSTPTITPNGASFTGSISVSLADATPGATIYYTLNGSSPTQSSPKYSGPMTISSDVMLKAAAFKPNMNPSSIASAWFAKVNNFDFALSNAGNLSVNAGSSVANTVSATLVSGGSQAVSLSVSGLPSGATGSFSTASCNPTCSSTLTISTSGAAPAGSSTIIVSATGGGVTKTTTFTLTVSVPVVSNVAAPTITPNGGSFTNSVAVTMATATSGASIYYTTDGSAPTQSSSLYTGTINLTTSTTLRAKAFKSGYNPSAETSASFKSDLVAYWKFDEGMGTTTADSSGNGNTGALVNGPVWTAGVAGNALYFDGTDDNVTVLDSATLNPTSAFTVSAWVNPAKAFTDFRSVLVKNYKYYLYSSAAGYCGDGDSLGGFSEASNATVCQPTPLPINAWTHLTLTYDGSTLTLYRDGVAVANSAAAGSLQPTTNNLQIGASQYGEFFNGLIDEVRIYSRALSAVEIQALYQQNAPFNFALANLGTRSVTAGSSVVNTISATLIGGSSQTVSFSVSGLPAGTTASFSQSSCAPTCSATLTLNTTGATPVGTSTITVSASAGSVTKTTAFALTVSAQPAVAAPTITPNGGSFSNSVVVSLATATSGAAIYYTIDGSTPTQSSKLYTGPMNVTASATVKAKAYLAGYNPSAETAATFTISPWTYCASEGSYCAFSGTKMVRYGTNGTYFTQVFTDGVSCDNSVFGDPVVGYPKACEYADTASVAFDFSLANSGDLSVAPGSAANNTIVTTLVSGNSQAVSFSVSGLPAGATASFSAPSCSPACSTLLTISASSSTAVGSFSITVAAAGGGVTKITSFTLNVSAALMLIVATPTITPNGGVYADPVSVTIQSPTSGASVYYTTDGSTPTQSSTLYSTPLVLTSSATVKAIAVKSSTSSAVASASFTSTYSQANYYVGKNGSDSNSCTQARSSTTPKLTIAAALACIGTSPGAGAGQTIEVAAGTYVESITNNLPSGSSWSAPFTLRAKSGDNVTIKASGAFNVRLYLPTSLSFFSIIQGFVFDGINTTEGQVSIGSCCDGPGYIRFQGNEFINTAHYHTVFIGRFSHHIEFLNNKIHGGTFTVDNQVGSNWGYPFYIEGSDNLIDGNELYNAPAWAIHVYSGYTEQPNRNIIRRNLIHDFGFNDTRANGIIFHGTTGGTGNIAYNNIIYNGSKGLGFGRCSSCGMYNNTIYNMSIVGIDYSSSTGATIKNNINYNPAASSGDLYGFNATGAILSNNLCTNTATGCTMTGNPVFRDPANGRFDLMGTSPAIDRGASLSMVPNDINGTARPLGAGYDIGAYESR